MRVAYGKHSTQIINNRNSTGGVLQELSDSLQNVMFWGIVTMPFYKQRGLKLPKSVFSVFSMMSVFLLFNFIL